MHQLFGYCFIAVLISNSSLAQIEQRAIDLAAEQAGARLCAELESSSIENCNIAFLPLFRDGTQKETTQIYPVIRAELARSSLRFPLYTRDETVWDSLVGEIDFGARRQDIMDTATIQRFGNVKGVDALLYGEVREASATSDGKGTVRISVYLSDVETGQLLWSSNVMSEYAPPPKPTPTTTERIKDIVTEHIFWLLAGVVVMILIMSFLKAVSRPRLNRTTERNRK